MKKCLTCHKELHTNNDKQILKYCSKDCREARPVDVEPFTGMTYQAMDLLIKNHWMEYFQEKYMVTKKDEQPTTEVI